MTTDRTQPARPAAPTDRAGAQPAERRNGDAFAALLDAHAATRANDERGDCAVRRDDRPARHDADRLDRASLREHAAARRDAADVSARRDRVEPSARARAGVSARHEGAGHADLQVAPESAAPAETVVDLAPPTGGTAAARADLAAVGVTATTPEPVAADLLAIARDLAAGRLAVPAAPVTNLQTAPEAPVLPQTPVAAVPTAPQAAAAAAPMPAQTAPETAATQTAPEIPDASGDARTPAAAADPRAAEAPTTPQAPTARAAEAPAQAAVATAPAEETAAPAQPAAASAAPKVEPQAAAPAQPTAQPAVASPQVQTSAPLAGQVAPHRAEPLHRAPAAVATLLHVAAERGITRAKMALRPAELGGIEIRLQSTAAGVAAQVVADSPEAARLLAQASDDLRRALEARDVTLLSLEVSTTADERQQSARGEWRDGDGTDAGLYGSADRGAGDPDLEPAPTTHAVIELPTGLLVDVLA